MPWARPRIPSLTTGAGFGLALPVALGFSVASPAFPWLQLLLAIGMLTVLGLVIGRRFGGNPVLWAVALAAAGIILIVMGAVLNIA